MKKKLQQAQSLDIKHFDSYDNECFCPVFESEAVNDVPRIQSKSDEKTSGGLHGQSDF
jgi:hypothetical protein